MYITHIQVFACMCTFEYSGMGCCVCLHIHVCIFVSNTCLHVYVKGYIVCVYMRTVCKLVYMYVQVCLHVGMSCVSVYKCVCVCQTLVSAYCAVIVCMCIHMYVYSVVHVCKFLVYMPA